MTVFEFIRDNRGLTKTFNEIGLLKYKVETYYAIYTRFLHYLNIGNIKTEALRKACRDFHTCEKTGWLVLKEMERRI